MTQPVASLGLAPDRAIRARLSALLIDGVILGVITRLLVPAFGVDSVGGVALIALGLQFLYFFVQEASQASTVGKRQSRLHVVQLDGTAPTVRQIAIRNALRIFDALPLFYSSGLVSVMWSGPGLRQRIGDKVAGTTVIRMEGAAKAKETPGWLLPTLTVASVLLSTVIYGALYRESRTPNVGENSLAAAPVAGYAQMDNSQAPAEGNFTAQAVANGQAVYEGPNKPMVRSWRITKHCTGGACGYEITREVPGEGNETGQLTQQPDGWHVTFPTRAFRAQCPGSSRITTVRRRSAYVIHFEPGGRAAQAHEANAFAADCGGSVRTLDWTAHLPTL